MRNCESGAVENIRKREGIIMQQMLLCVFLIATAIQPISAQITSAKQAQTIVWKINNLNQIFGHPVTLLGQPLVLKEQAHTSVFFDGVDDGMIIDQIPMRGWKTFTIEVLFKPSGDGPVAPRFIHFTDDSLNRGTFELRLTRDKQWYLDTFLKNGKTNKGVALIDSSLLHPSDKWHWAALTYNGKKMTSYVNGVKQLEGDVSLPPMLNGKLSLGVRLNQVAWFKGSISEIRFHPRVLNISDLTTETPH